MSAFEKTSRIGISPSKPDYSVGAWRTLFMNHLVGLKMDEPTLLRVDDTNTNKFHDGTFTTNYASLKNILENQMGIGFLYTPEVGVENSIGVSLIQSENRQVYQTFAQKLVEQNLAHRGDNDSVVLSLNAYIANFGDSLEVSELNRPTRQISLRRFFQVEEDEDKLIPIIAAGGRPLFSIASVVDDQAFHVGVVVRSVKTRDIQVQQEMLRTFFDFDSLQHLYLPTWDTPEGARVGYMDLIKDGIGSRAIMSYMASSLGGNPAEIYPDIDSLVDGLDIERFSKNSSQPFEIDRLRSISARLNKIYRDRGGDMFESVRDMSSAHQDGLYEMVIESESLARLISSENRSLVDVYENIKRIINPNYEQVASIAGALGLTVDAFRSLLNEIIDSLNDDNQPIELSSKIDELSDRWKNSHVYSGLRYVLTGLPNGVHPQYSLDYLSEIDGLNSRLVLARTKIEG